MSVDCFIHKSFNFNGWPLFSECGSLLRSDQPHLIFLWSLFLKAILFQVIFNFSSIFVPASPWKKSYCTMFKVINLSFGKSSQSSLGGCFPWILTNHQAVRKKLKNNFVMRKYLILPIKFIFLGWLPRGAVFSKNSAANTFILRILMGFEISCCENVGFWKKKNSKFLNVKY